MADAGDEQPALVGGYTVDEMLAQTPIDLAYRGHIKPELWFTAPAQDATPEHLVTYLASTLASYTQQNLYDDDLFVAYREDYAAWNQAMFERMPAPCRRCLKIFLRTRGLFTGRNNQPVAPQLAALVQAEERLPWNDDELRNVPLAPESSMNEYRTNLIQNNPGGPPQPQPAPPADQPADGQPPPEDQIVRASQQPQQQPQPPGPQPPPVEPLRRPSQPIPSIENPGPLSPYDRWARSSYWRHTPYPAQPWNGPHMQPTPQNAEYDPYGTLPPQHVDNERLDLAKSAQFVKTFDDSRKYTGEPYDLLDDKMKMFFNICYHAEIQPSQFHAVFPRMLKGRAETYYLHFVLRTDTFATAYLKVKTHFDTDLNHEHYYTDWTTTTFAKVRAQNPDKDLHDILRIMLDKLQLCQRALGRDYSGEDNLRTTVIKACRGVPELEMALFKPAQLCEELFSDLRSAVETRLTRTTAIHVMDDESDQYYVDRRYNGQHRGRGGRPSQNLNRGNRGYRRGGNGRANYGNGRGGHYDNRRGRRPWKKICYICRKPGCWSTKHPVEEQRTAKRNWMTQCEYDGRDEEDFTTFLADFEGFEADEDDEEFHDCEEGNDEDQDAGNHFTDAGPDDPVKVANVQFLENESFMHRLTGEDIFKAETTVAADQFVLKSKYDQTHFQGILPDTGASMVSTAGHEQFLALQRENPDCEFDATLAGQAKVKFGNGKIIDSLGAVEVETPIGRVKFHIVDAQTPFLLCLADMDRLGVYYNNVRDEIICPDGATVVPVLRKWGHPWFFLDKTANSVYFLSEIELKRLHRRFGHPATDRLCRMLEKAGHPDVDKQALAEIEKFCHHCQLNGPAPRRFKFTLRDDREFNYEILVDVMYLSGRPVLHVVDWATAFQGARFLKSMSAKVAWQTLRALWIDTYQGPPDIIRHDAGTNFASQEFRSEARVMGIECKQVPVEAHWSIGKVERYHQALRRAYEILYAELHDTTDDDAILQMAVKAVNDTAGPDGLVPTLLVFGAYPRVSQDSPPSPLTWKRAEAVSKAMKALRKTMAERQVRDALNTKVGPVAETEYPLQCDVRVWREKEGWKGPYKVISVQGHDITLDMPAGPATFRSTVVQRYYRNEDEDVRTSQPEEASEKPQTEIVRPSSPEVKDSITVAYVSRKENDDGRLAIKLRQDGVITTPGLPFEESDKMEVDDLIGRGVFRFERWSRTRHGEHRLFKSRMVREVKGKTTKPYEKSRLIIQGYNDENKDSILTQSPTIQRMSQRTILAIAPSLIRDNGMSLMLRDITQAYPQSKSELQRTIIAELPTELRNRYPEGTVIRVVRPLYGIAEAGVHWFDTYQKHHREKLGMDCSTYDPCLLITKIAQPFGISGMQTDDTLLLGTAEFHGKEEAELKSAGLRAKPKSKLTSDRPVDYNGARMTMNTDGSITTRQKGQGAKLALIDPAAEDAPQRYLEQRARGAYIASICQPEASYDLSVAAQVQNPENEHHKFLNKRLSWQMENALRGITYVPLDLKTAKLFVFADGSFANNQDLTSQLGYVIVLANEARKDSENEFTMTGNILHWSSTKCKRVTRSVLASEIYGMVNGVDIGISLATTIRMVTMRLSLPDIPVVICTDSYSLYECLVKLGTTKEKRLMIDIMALRQSYETREIAEVRWIDGKDNPADAMTKTAPNLALRKLIDDNELRIRVDGSVERPDAKVVPSC